MRWMLSLIAPALALALPVAAGAQKTNDAAAAMWSLGNGGLTGEALAGAIAKAAAAPLGSRDNPVRADLPQGERAYLAKLRCADGTAPAFTRDGSAGMGVYGYMLDAYTVTCAGGPPVTLYMDMYHDHRETATPAGFAIAEPTA